MELQALETDSESEPEIVIKKKRLPAKKKVVYVSDDDEIENPQNDKNIVIINKFEKQSNQPSKAPIRRGVFI